MIGKENRARRNNLLAEHYLLATQTGKSAVVKGLVRSFGLSESYIYRLLGAHRKQFPEKWTFASTNQRELDLIEDSPKSPSLMNWLEMDDPLSDEPHRGWFQKLIDRLFKF